MFPQHLLFVTKFRLAGLWLYNSWLSDTSTRSSGKMLMQGEILPMITADYVNSPESGETSHKDCTVAQEFLQVAQF